MKALGTHSLVQMKEGAAPGLVAVNTLQRNVAEQIRHGLAVVRPADGLGEDHGNVDDLQRGKKSASHRAKGRRHLSHTSLRLLFSRLHPPRNHSTVFLEADSVI